MFNRVRQTVRALTDTSISRVCHFGLLAGIGPAISKTDGYAVLVIIVIALGLVAFVALVAIYAAKPARRSAVALAVLERILRWKA